MPFEALEPQLQLEIRCRQAVEELLAGEYLSVFKGRGIEFDEVRPYQPGDEVRSIDWNVTARTGEPFVKQFIEERDLTIYLAVDLSASGLCGSGGKTRRQAAAEIAALLAFSAVTHHDRVGLLLFTSEVERHLPPAKGQIHVSRLLQHIRRHEPAQTGTNLTAPLDFVLHTAKRRAIVFLISDFHATGYLDALQAATQRHEVIALHLVDPAEIQLPPTGLIRVRDAESGKLQLLDAGHGATRDAYAGRAAHLRQVQANELLSGGADHFQIVIGSDYAGELHQFFRSRLSRL